MSDLFASGHIADLILVFTALELALLAVYNRRTGRGIAAADLISTLLSGAFLMVALRCALRGAWWVWIGFWLAAALVAHIADLRRRWSPP